MKIKMHDSIYEIQEDSILLLDSILKDNLNILNQNICEMGIGSGYISKLIQEKFPQNNFTGIDINENALKYSKSQIKNLKIIKSDLFEKTNEKFDLIYFNTPYLPLEDGDIYENLNLKEKAIYGGKNAYEQIERFIEQINDNLNSKGIVYILFSSLSNPKYIEEKLKFLEFEFEYVNEKSMGFFETLYVLKIKKSSLLKELNNISNIKYLARGKHSKVLEGLYKEKKIIIKIANEQHIEKEIFFDNKLKGEFFINNIIFFGKNYFIREKASGLFINDFLLKKEKNQIILILNKCLEISKRLDELKINKFEMTNPYKHILIDENNNIKMIDFERCIYSENPKNTRQFLNYIRKNKENLEKKQIYIDEKKLDSLGKKLKENIFKIDMSQLFSSKYSS